MRRTRSTGLFEILTCVQTRQEFRQPAREDLAPTRARRQVAQRNVLLSSVFTPHISVHRICFKQFNFFHHVIIFTGAYVVSQKHWARPRQPCRQRFPIRRPPIKTKNSSCGVAFALIHMSDRIECATQPAIQLPTSQQASCAFLTQVQMLTIKFRCNVYLRIKKKTSIGKNQNRQQGVFHWLLYVCARGLEDCEDLHKFTS